jgi:rifampicin phosphotransferase
VQPGEVLIAPATSPAWTPLFATVAAVVTDAGGVLSHCAVVAREYRIPAVVGTGTATTTIHDGQMVEVDGTSGVVRLSLDR